MAFFHINLIPLTYSYLYVSSSHEVRLHSEKIKYNLVFSLICTNFVPVNWFACARKEGTWWKSRTVPLL